MIKVIGIKSVSLLVLYTACFVLTGPHVFGQEKNVIQLVKGSYSNVLIAIKNDVNEDEYIIENLKAMFTAASNRLYNATKTHLYFKEITILVPSTWVRNNAYGVARTESYDTANIVVHEFYNDAKPYINVNNPFGCGIQGEPMQVTPYYILNGDNLVNDMGPSDNVLVQHWAFYRWGLYEEYYDVRLTRNKTELPGYISELTGEYEGTRCSLAIKGGVKLNNGTGDCPQDPQVGYSRNCHFVPDPQGQTAAASLLFDTGIYSIYGFCEEDPDGPGRLHNREAPNRHNRLCSSKSAWEVMTEKTSDFEFGPHEVFDTTPVFNVIQAPGKRNVVLVLDTSGSMADYDRFNKVIQSSIIYINNTIPEGSQLGIVGFSYSATVYAELTEIVNDTSKKELIDKLPMLPDGGTSIGSGVIKGIEVLGNFAAGGYMLLLSDGHENTAPSIINTYETVDDSGVIIDTIAVSDQADPEMESLSKRTNGIPMFCPDSDAGACLIGGFQGTITSRPDVGATVVPFQILSSDVYIPASIGFISLPVIIDAELGTDTVFTVTWTVNYLITVEVFGPEGSIYDSDNVDLQSKIISVRIPDAKAGQWSVMVNNSGPYDERASVSVTSKPRTADVQPTTVSVTLGSRNVDHSTMPALSIYARVQKGDQPVVDAVVDCLITSSLGWTDIITLLDNGAGADILRGDGVYSRYFLNFTSNGRYSVKVDAAGSTDDVEVANQRPRGKRASQGTEADPIPDYMRTASGGSFEVVSYSPDAGDRLAPSRIHDLQYTAYSYDNSTVTLRWTAVGDDLDQGMAFRNEMRYATAFRNITDAFNTTILITNNQTVSGNLSVVAAPGVVEELTISLPERGAEVVYYFAIRAWDEAGNAGDISNVASLAILYFEEVIEEPTVQPDKTEVNLALIIGLSSVALVIFCGVLVGFIVVMKKKKKEEEEVDRNPDSGKVNPAYVYA